VLVNVSGSTLGCVGDSIILGTKAGQGETFTWMRNDTALNNLSNELAVKTPGKYTVVLKNSSYCTDTAKPIFISFRPKSTPSVIKILGNTQICIGTSSELTVISKDTATVSSWWTKDGQYFSAGGDSLKITDAGTYNWVGINAAGCRNISNAINLQTINYPSVSFYVPAKICVMDSASFNDGISIDPKLNYNWNFGDGQTSTLPGPYHQFSNSGKYKVSLSVANATGCKTNYSDSIEILPVTAPAFTHQDIGHLRIKFNVSDSSGIDYIWRFGDGAVDAGYPVLHEYSTPGTYIILLKTINPSGCTASGKDSVKIIPSFTGSDSSANSFLKVYPNPGNSEFNIEYQLNIASPVKLSLYAIDGTLISKLLELPFQASGNYVFTLKAADIDLKPGMYLLKAAIGNRVINKLLIYQE
jgi:tripartite motif-containing protein 71